MTATVAVVAALAVYRLTMLVTADTITEPARERVIDWLNARKHPGRPVMPESTPAPDGPFLPGEPTVDLLESGPLVVDGATMVARATDPHRLAYLLDCPWCASIWLAAPASAVTYWWSHTPAWWIAAGTLAASAVTGIVATFASPGR